MCSNRRDASQCVGPGKLFFRTSLTTGRAGPSREANHERGTIAPAGPYVALPPFALHRRHSAAARSTWKIEATSRFDNHVFALGRMSALGHERPSCPLKASSASPFKADLDDSSTIGCLVPITDFHGENKKPADLAAQREPSTLQAFGGRVAGQRKPMQGG